jgi:hypothetical protein
MESYILKEGVLNDDYLKLSDAGKVFKGGYIAILVYYTFTNEWCNKEHVKKFRKESQLNKYLKKHYPNFEF